MAKIERNWIDLETTGLSPNDEVILELGLVLTDRWGEVVDQESWLIYEDGYEGVIEHAIPYVKEMHDKSGLWADSRAAGSPLLDVETEALGWLDDHGVKVGQLPMCGNSVGFDRAFIELHMPTLFKNFHYRNIDVSTLKECCRDLNPLVFAQLPAKKEAHRALPDLEETIAEYKFYIDNFLWH